MGIRKEIKSMLAGDDVRDPRATIMAIAKLVSIKKVEPPKVKPIFQLVIDNAFDATRIKIDFADDLTQEILVAAVIAITNFNRDHFGKDKCGCEGCAK